MTRTYRLLAVLLVLAGFAVAQNIQKVDQGKPGTQGPWPVTGTLAIVQAFVADGGTAFRTAPVQCNPLTSVYTTMNLSTVATALTPSKVQRYYVVACVTVETSGVPNVRCRADFGTPVNSAGNVGDVMTTGDCIVYPLAGNADGGVDPISCISSAATTYVSFFQCAP